MAKKKMVIPEKHPDCPQYEEINDALLHHLIALEYFNNAKLEVFWELNKDERT